VLPAGVPAAIRRAMWDALGLATAGRVLDLGAGTGRIGAAFVDAGDAYIGVDASAGMLARFAEKMSGRGGAVPALALADGQALPFPAACFDAVLMVQVIGGTTGWRGILSEVRRVLRPGGPRSQGEDFRPARPKSLEQRTLPHDPSVWGLSPGPRIGSMVALHLPRETSRCEGSGGVALRRAHCPQGAPLDRATGPLGSFRICSQILVRYPVASTILASARRILAGFAQCTSRRDPILSAQFTDPTESD
jgi:SAM-dependent methyltransferase